MYTSQWKGGEARSDKGITGYVVAPRAKWAVISYRRRPYQVMDNPNTMGGDQFKTETTYEWNVKTKGGLTWVRKGR